MKPFRVRRSLMITPGNRPERMAKAATLAVDSVAFDLEDGVAPADKPAARRAIADAMRMLDFGGRERVVRINAVGTGDVAVDLAALPIASLDALFVPKVESAEQVRWLAAELDQLEAKACVDHKRSLILTIETPRGLLNALQIADASDRSAALFFGSGDYAAATNCALTPAGLAVPRGIIVAAAAAAGLQAIDAAAFGDVKSSDLARADALVGKEAGFSGKLVFHPNQIDAINDVFTPSQQEVERAKRIIAAYQDARDSGRGTAVVDGTFIAIDIVLMAERTLAIARHAAGRGAA